MQIKLDIIDSIENIDHLVDNSWNGTCFAYGWFLCLKECKQVLKIFDDNNLIGFMPLFVNDVGDSICQSTMYIPYGGPVIFNVPTTERKKIQYIREIEHALSDYLKGNYQNISFSTDTNIIDIMPFIRGDFIPELRYTYKLDLVKNIDDIFQGFGSDRKKEIKNAINSEVEFYVDKNLDYFDEKRCMEWESKYGFESSADFVKKFIKTAIEKDRGMVFIAKKGDIVYGCVCMVWDTDTAYIMYSYFDKQYDVGVSYLYYNIFKYLKDIGIKSVDFEGSVYETVENYNISFSAYQARYYNLHFSRNDKQNILDNLYKYFDK